MAIIYGSNGTDPNLGGTGTGDFIFGWAQGFTEFDDIGNDILRGFGGNDFLYGGNGDDILDGGAGVDTMQGGFGDDTYYVNASTDNIVEFAGEGEDTVYTTLFGHVLRENFEKLIGVYTAAGDVNLRGNGADNYVAVAESFGGTVGLSGHDGDDQLVAATKAAGATANVTNFLAGGNGNDMLVSASGAEDNNYLYGDAGNDQLYSGGFFCRMVGGADNDTYFVASDAAVVEQLNGGTDTVRTTQALHRLSANVENLVAAPPAAGLLDRNFTGNALDNLITSTGGADVISGAAGNDTLRGGGGADRLIGGTGVDELYGGAGADVFVFRAIADSPRGFGEPDRIMDLSASDRIDFSAIDANETIGGNQAFVLDQGGLFDAGEYYVTAVAGGWNIYLNTDNSVGNFWVFVTGTSVFPADSLLAL